MIAGAMLIVSAVVFFLYNNYEEYCAGKEAELLLNNIQSAISDDTVPPDLAENVESADSPMLIDGYEYIGVLSIAALDRELPVMAEWDYERLKMAPCRHFGSYETDDLVIAAHNYKSHFGYLSKLSVGDEILFTDMDGVEIRYGVVLEPKRINDTEVDMVQNSGYDLVLYTCTFDGNARVAVFCNRIDEKKD